MKMLLYQLEHMVNLFHLQHMNIMIMSLLMYFQYWMLNTVMESRDMDFSDIYLQGMFEHFEVFLEEHVRQLLASNGTILRPQLKVLLLIGVRPSRML